MLCLNKCLIFALSVLGVLSCILRGSRPRRRGHCGDNQGHHVFGGKHTHTRSHTHTHTHAHTHSHTHIAVTGQITVIHTHTIFFSHTNVYMLHESCLLRGYLHRFLVSTSHTHTQCILTLSHLTTPPGGA